MNLGGGGGGNAQQMMFDQAEKSREAEQRRQNAVRDAETTINTKFGDMFTPDFWKGRQDAALGYYKPQLDDQFANARKDLTYWLGDRGLLNSTVANEKTADLQKLFDTNTRTVGNNVLDMVNSEKGKVNEAQQGLISDARSNGDAEAASNASNAQIASLSAPDTYSPLANMFVGFTDALKTQAALEQASALSNGAYKPTFNTGLFGRDRESVRNVG